MCCKAIAFDYICYFTGTAINVFRYLDSFLKIPEITVSSFGQDLLEKSENLARDLAKKKDANKKSNKVAPQKMVLLGRAKEEDEGKGIKAVQQLDHQQTLRRLSQKKGRGKDGVVNQREKNSMEKLLLVCPRDPRAVLWE
jgi:hypothetical protein